MQLSIVTVCHRSGRKMAGYVSSFLQLHGDPGLKDRIEFVVVENSGEAGFDSVVQPLRDAGFRTTVIASPNEGFGKGNNLGVQRAQGDLLVLANPDIRFQSSLAPLLTLGPSFSWGTALQLTPQGSAYSIDLMPEHKGLLFELLKLHRLVNRLPRPFLRHCYVVGSFLLVSRRVFAQCGGFSPAFFLYYEEAELARRLQAQAGPPQLLRSVQVFHEGFGSHTSSDSIRTHELEGFLTYCRVTGQPELAARRLRVLKLLAHVSAGARQRSLLLQQAIQNAQP